MRRYTASIFDLEHLDKYHKETLDFSKQTLGTIHFYGFDISIDDKMGYLGQIGLRQREVIQEEIGIPSFAISRPKQNKYIFNNCYFYDKIYKEKKIAQGGNSDVFVMKPDVYEYSSTSYEVEGFFKKHQNPSKYLSKHLVFKKNTHQSYSKINNEKSLPSRQAKVVAFMRGGSCLFLPKYYLNIEADSPYHKKLFSDYLPGDTLDNFLAFNSQTISIYTKIYLIIQVLQALRFSNSYGVVHLDVKENNIIVLKRLICKIFDFGESYHYSVCGQNHKPKYTRLYASPEVVTSFNGRAFTEKSDVFSVGIMIHKILFNKYPYYFPDQTSFESSNFKQTLRNKTFYLPEQIEEYGHQELIALIYQLILRCIDMAQSRRPYLEWITLIMKSCFNIFTSQ